MLEFRDKLKYVYGKYDLFILPVIKYALALFTFISVNRTLGYMEALNNAVLILVLSAICAILPWNAIPVLGIGMVILHCFGLGMEVGACAAAFYMVLLIFYFRLVPKDGLALTLTSATCSLGLPGVVPIGLGLLRGPLSALTAVCSMMSWFFIRVVTEIAAPMKFAPDSSVLDVVRAMLDNMLDNRELLIYAITFAAVVLIVSVIRSSGIRWAWELAILVGAALQVGLLLLLGSMLQIGMDPVPVLTGTLIAVLISFILAFFVYNVDYKGSQHLQFEDDEYVYYVKAIPKKTSGVQPDPEEEDEEFEEEE